MTQLLPDKPTVVFKHDRVPTQMHNELAKFLKKHFPERRIGRRWSNFWPPRFPEITTLEFLLWGFVKEEIYVPPVPMTLNNLKVRILTATAKSYQPLLQNVWHEVEYRLVVCRLTNGANTEFA
jgi:hypothetical protein